MAALSSSAGASDGAVLELVGPALRGKTKWLGAAMVDGTLLGIPGHATGVLRVDPRLDRVSGIGEGACNKRGINTFKWLRGVTGCLGLKC